MADGLKTFSALDIIDRAKSRAASFVESAGHEKTGTSDLLIGIDFGTTYTGVAFAFSSSVGPQKTAPRTLAEAEAIIEKVVVVKNWPSVVQLPADKTPTVLAYGHGELVAWGGKVKPSHRTQIAHFKLGLQDNIGRHYGNESATANSLLGGFLRNSNWRHQALPTKKAVDYTTDYLTEVRKYVIETFLPRHYGKTFLNGQQISYTLTVPAIWTDKAKELTRKAAVDTGIPSNKLALITEPEAAALYCATTCTEVDLRDGDRFLVCDAGGGTVVI